MSTTPTLNWVQILSSQGFTEGGLPPFSFLYKLVVAHLDHSPRERIEENLNTLFHVCHIKFSEENPTRFKQVFKHFKVVVQSRLFPSGSMFVTQAQEPAFQDILKACEIEALPAYLHDANQVIRTRTFKKELELLRRLSPLYGVNEKEVEHKAWQGCSSFYLFFLPMLDWFRTLFNLPVSLSHPACKELGLRLCKFISHPCNRNQSMDPAKHLIQQLKCAEYLMESVEDPETCLLNPLTKLINVPTSAENVTMPIQESPSHSRSKERHARHQGWTYSYSENLMRREEEKKQITEILQAAKLVELAHQEKKKRMACEKKIEILELHRKNSCVRFLKLKVAETDIDDVLTEASEIFSLKEAEVREVMGVVV